MNNTLNSARIITVRGIQAADVISIPSSVSLSLPSGNTWGLLWCIEGILNVTLGERKIAISAGEACLFAPLTSGIIKSDRNTSYLLIRFECFYEPLKTLTESIWFISEQSTFFLMMIKEIVKPSVASAPGEWHYSPDTSENFGDEQLIIDSLEELLILRFRHDLSASLLKRNGGHKDFFFRNLIIEKVNDYITENLSEKLSVEDIARSMNYSRQHLSTLYKNCTGFSINEFITQKKLETAKKFFSQEGASVSSVSEMLGYSSPQYFCRVFQKVFGISPTEYLKYKKNAGQDYKRNDMDPIGPVEWGTENSKNVRSTINSPESVNQSEGSLYRGICGNRFSTRELLHFLDDAFETKESGYSMLSVAPKLFRETYRPTDYNYIIADNHKIRAAVGVYPLSMKVSGTKLRALLVGNISVLSSHRLNGYINDCMDMSMKAISESGVDFAILNGLTQRYAYFGFEMGGACGMFMVDNRSLVHAYQSVEAPEGYSVTRFTPDNKTLLKAIRNLFESQPSFTERPMEKLAEILTGWGGTCYAVYSPEDEFAGYFIHNGSYNDAVNEIMCTREEFAPALLRMSYAVLGQSRVIYMVPEYQRIMYDLLSDVASKCELTTTNNFCIFNYHRVLGAALKLRMGSYEMKDGQLTLRIDGVKKTERLLISVSDGVPSVTEYDGVCEYNYSHLQAMKLFFGLTSKERRSLPAFAQSWFQLPLFIHFADND